MKNAPAVEQYFQSLADSAPSPNAKSKILFTLANYVSEQDKARALTIMTDAYRPEIVYSPRTWTSRARADRTEEARRGRRDLRETRKGLSCPC
jgi:hypothetical protein